MYIEAALDHLCEQGCSPLTNNLPLDTLFRNQQFFYFIFYKAWRLINIVDGKLY